MNQWISRTRDRYNKIRGVDGEVDRDGTIFRGDRARDHEKHGLQYACCANLNIRCATKRVVVSQTVLWWWKVESTLKPLTGPF